MIKVKTGVYFWMALFLINQNTQADEIKFINIGMLQSWFSSNGCEIEVGRTHNSEDQQDGFAYPAIYKWQDMQAAKGLWIGTTNFSDPLSQEDYNYKVVHVGPRTVDETLEIMPTEFKLIGKFDHPEVVVNGIPASDLYENDILDEIDKTLPTDRMIINTLNTSIGITMTRKIYANSTPGHDSYFIYDYVFTNTGIYDLDGNAHQLTLTDVVFFFQYRWAMTKYICSNGYSWAPSFATWGVNTVNEVLHSNYGDSYNATYSWHGLLSMYNGNNIGGPNLGNAWKNVEADGFLGASQFPGMVLLYADKSTSDKSNNPEQFFSAPFFSSDHTINYNNSQFDADKMTAQYQYMSKGLPEETFAEDLDYPHNPSWQDAPFNNTQNTDTYNSFNFSGYSQGIGYGPYTIAPGESIHIVFAECVGSIDWNKRIEIGKKWYFEIPPYELPDGSVTDDKDQYKDAWVFTGRDTLFQSFNRAIGTWENSLVIDPTPPPPSKFEVTAGGDRITLKWADNASGYSNFGGYEIYRQSETSDTSFDMIYQCGLGTDKPVVHEYDDFDVEQDINYYYYIVSYDDGSVSTSESGKTLYSSLFWTKTNEPAFLLRAPEVTLDDVRIVPNPYNLSTMEGSTLETANRLKFYNLPPKCNIRIYTEAGDLVKTITHNNNTGEDSWDICNREGDLVASGLYIAFFEITEDYEINSQTLLKKGERVFEKFIIIR